MLGQKKKNDNYFAGPATTYPSIISEFLNQSYLLSLTIKLWTRCWAITQNQEISTPQYLEKRSLNYLLSELVNQKIHKIFMYLWCKKAP